MEELKEGDLVLCTVERISGTTVFVKIDNTDKEGTIITSEIAPGRIRNIREYVVPKKKIVCKVLSITKPGNIHLSLRRVTSKEKKEVIEKYEKEKSSMSIIKSVLKEKAEEIAEKIKSQEKTSLYEFIQTCRDSPEKLKKYFTDEQTKRIYKILKEKKEKQVEVKAEFELESNKKNGLSIIKKVLLPYKNQITYIAAGKFLLKIKAENYKKANHELQKILQSIEQKAKEEKAEFKIKEK